ncbi:MAG: alpha-1,2-fucosyltransferase [Lachnospiraceae bacterium]|nr:alpha-1,2-fucosyltransferase [Lachnospiraceae bacterium]
MIQMSGGLGNQMFFYALYEALRHEGKSACIEEFTHYGDIGRRDNCLEDIFSLHYEKADREEYKRLTDSSMQPWKRLQRKLFGRKGKVYKEKDAIIFEPQIFAQDDCYAEGYWQSLRYFEKVQDELRKDFVFGWEKFPEKAKEYRKQMEQTTSVSLHIRRGDYLNEKFAPIYGGICTEAYYESAKAYIKEKYPDCVFYLFTNDAEWGRRQVSGDVVFVECTDSDNAYVDMALMGCCKHNIIANSSFSWWGAWLNPNPDKIVLAPAKWLNTSEGQDIYYGLCDVKMDANGILQK